MSKFNDKEIDALFRDASEQIPVPDVDASWQSAAAYLDNKSTGNRKFLFFLLFGLSGLLALGSILYYTVHTFHTPSIADNTYNTSAPADLAKTEQPLLEDQATLLHQRSPQTKTSTPAAAPQLAATPYSSGSTNNHFTEGVHSDVDTELAESHSSVNILPLNQPLTSPSSSGQLDTPNQPIQNTTDPIPSLALDTLMTRSAYPLPIATPSNSVLSKAVKIKSSTLWSVFVGARLGLSLGLPHSIISANNKNYRFTSEDNATISLLPALDLGLQRNSWMISSGVEFQQFKNTYQSQTIIKEYKNRLHFFDNGYWLINNTEYIFVDSTIHYDQGKPIYRTDTVVVNIPDSSYIMQRDSVLVPYTDSTSEQQTTVARSNYIEIPLLIGYEFGSKKLKVSLHSGVAMGFLTQFRQRQLPPLITSVDKLPQHYTYKKTLIHLLFKARFTYQFNNIGLYSDWYYKSNLNQILETNDDLKWRQNNLNFGVGVFYKF